MHGIKTLNDFIDFLDLPKLEKSDFLIFPINDANEEILNEGGSLWSILVYSKAEKNFIIMTQSRQA